MSHTPPDPGPLLSMESVVLRFGDHTILDGIDLQVMPQQRLVVMGQSGGGKSTLLRLVMGILQPNSGRVSLLGQEINQLGRRDSTSCVRRSAWSTSTARSSVH